MMYLIVFLIGTALAVLVVWFVLREIRTLFMVLAAIVMEAKHTSRQELIDGAWIFGLTLVALGAMYWWFMAGY